jgi:hypothetical protein
MIRKIYKEANLKLYDFGIGKYSAVLKKNKQLKNSAKNIDRCFILATGPSIKNQDLNNLENEFCISVSNFFVHPLFKKINPHYHIFAGSHPPITTEQMASWWRDAEDHFRGSSVDVLIHATNKKIQEKFGFFKEHKVYYYLGEGKYPVDFSKAIPKIQTVVHIAIYLAIYMGFKKIYLLGCDHSWLMHHGISQHFYKEEQHSFTRNNYSEWSEVKDIGFEFETHSKLWDVYRKIRMEAGKINVQIYNSTPGSLLDIFPKKNLSEVLNIP